MLAPELYRANGRQIFDLDADQTAVDREIDAVADLRANAPARKREDSTVLHDCVGRAHFPEQSLRAFVSRDDELTVRLREDGAGRNRRLEFPVTTIRVQPDDLAFGVDPVDVASIRRRKRRKLGPGRFEHISLPEIHATRISLRINDRNAPGVGVEGENSIDCRCLIDRPHGRIEPGISVDTTSSSTAWDAKEERLGAVILYSRLGGTVWRCLVVIARRTEQRQQ